VPWTNCAQLRGRKAGGLPLRLGGLADRKATSPTEDTRPSVRREFEKERGDRVLDGVGEHAGAHGFAPLCYQAEQDAHERDGQGAAPPLIQMDGAE
jgi:hypothetical protein